MNEFSKNLHLLKLSYLQENFESFLQSFERKADLARNVIERLIEKEVCEQKKKTLERRLQQSKIGSFHPMADFDWAWPEEISRELVESLFTLDFLAKKENVVLLGPQGVGKTMIAQNLAHLTAFSGKSSLFTTAADLVMTLKDATGTGSFRSRLARYVKPALLVIDEIGYLSFDNKAADLLYQVMSKRYEKASTAMTTNLAFQDWPQFFPGASSVVALIDRVVHHAHIVNIKGDSYRLKQSKLKLNQTKGKK